MTDIEIQNENLISEQSQHQHQQHQQAEEIQEVEVKSYNPLSRESEILPPPPSSIPTTPSKDDVSAPATTSSSSSSSSSPSNKPTEFPLIVGGNNNITNSFRSSLGSSSGGSCGGSPSQIRMPRKSTISVGGHKHSPSQMMNSPSYFSKSSPNLDQYKKLNFNLSTSSANLTTIFDSDNNQPIRPDLDATSTSSSPSTKRKDVTPPPSPTKPFNSESPSITIQQAANNFSAEELNMNLAQLLACFPDPPTVIPVLLSSNKARRETVYTFVSQPFMTSSTNSTNTLLLSSLNTSSNNLLPNVVPLSSSSAFNSTTSLIVGEDLKLSSSSSFSSNSEIDIDTSSIVVIQQSPSPSPSPVKSSDSNFNENITLSGNDSTENSTITTSSNLNDKEEKSIDIEIEKEKEKELVKKEGEKEIEIIQDDEVKEMINETKSIIISTEEPTITTSSPLKGIKNEDIIVKENNSSKEQEKPTNQQNLTPPTTPNNKYMRNSLSPDINLTPTTSPVKEFTPTRSSHYNSICITSSPHGRTYSVSQKLVSPLQSPTSLPPPIWEVNLNYLTTEIREFNDLSASSNSPNYELLLKGTRNELSQQDQNRLIFKLLEINTADSIKMLERANEALNFPSSSSGSSSSGNSTKKSLFSVVKAAVKETKFLKPSKVIMYFGIPGLPVQINQELTDELVLTCYNSKSKYKVNLGPPSKTHSLQITQNASGKLKKKESITISFKLVLKTTIRMRRLISIDIENGGRHYIVIQVESCKTAFGEPLETTEMTEDGTYQVPLALVNLKNALLSHGGLDEEYIFRVPPSSESELIAVKEIVNKETIKCNDVHIISTLIKTWFRELRNPLLSVIPHNKILNFNNDSSPEQDTISLLNSLQNSPVQASIFLWLIDLLALVSTNESKNKMSIKNLAVIIAPNLYNPSSTLSPQDSMMVSQKTVSFIQNVIILKKNNQL